MSKGISESIICITGFVVGLPPNVLDPHYALSEQPQHVMLMELMVFASKTHTRCTTLRYDGKAPFAGPFLKYPC